MKQTGELYVQRRRLGRNAAWAPLDTQLSEHSGNSLSWMRSQGYDLDA
jgi:hypothetical protein